jgi:hypothetical protein
MKTYIGLTAAALLMSGSAVFAESKLVELGDIATACAGDIKSFCAEDIIGGTGLRACMKDHLTQLSGGCFEALMTVVTQSMPKATDYVFHPG